MWRAGLALGLAATAGAVLAADLPAQDPPANQEPPEAQASMVLLVSGGVRDGELVLGPAFAYEGPTPPPAEPGPYRLQGLDAEGETLFSVTLTPGEISDGGKGFTAGIPFDAAWTEALDRIDLRGPEGVATLDRSDGARAMLVRDRVTGQVRAILRDAPTSGRLPAGLEADSARLEIIRGLPRPPQDPPQDPPGALPGLNREVNAPGDRVSFGSRPGSSAGRATDF